MAAASTSASNNRPQANGVLTIAASQTANSAKAAGPKPSAPKLKIVVRRLPPALTEAEFTAVLGQEWMLGQGKADYFIYKLGKDSKDPSKPSRPSRAYLHLVNESHLLDLSELVRQSVFEDAQNTFTNSCLVGPPTVEFAPYGRVPGGRRRQDARAGTIDQDPEFMAFLEELANPTSSKENNSDGNLDNASAKLEKVTVTPLVQYLKDKKANKHKEAAVKAAKKQEAALAKGKSAKESSTSPEDVKKKGRDVKLDKAVERAAKETVKILNREAVTKLTSDIPIKLEGSSTDSPKLDLNKVPGRQRNAVIAAHVRMLQRDLGLTPAQAHRQVRRDNADAQKAERVAATTKITTDTKVIPSQAVQSPVIPTAPKASSTQPNSRRARAKASNLGESENSKGFSNTTPSNAPLTPTPSAPIVLLKKFDTARTTPFHPTQPTKPAIAVNPRKPSGTVPSEGATQAFIKHANPSQGVTEALLKEAMEKFGAVLMVEIDKRKGFAYLEFAEPGSLKKAMAANPVSVAQGTVQVMQRKGTSLPPEKKPIHQAPQPALHAPPHVPSRGGRIGRGGNLGRRGGRGGGRGGGNTAPASAPTGPAAKS